MSDHSPTTFPGSTNGSWPTARASRGAGPYDRADSPEGVSDDLAALFLGVEDEGDSPKAQTQVELKPTGGAGQPALSLLVLGNLPVHAPGWASQYARDRHRESGRPLGLLTLADEAARLEVFGVPGLDGSVGTDLSRALQRVVGLGADLIVRLPEAEAGWIGGECGAASMTILAGADDPAIVGAYQSIKSISQDLPPDVAGPSMRIAVAGSAEPVAQDAALKLARAAERFLGMKVERESPVRRIDAGASTELYHGEAPAWADVPDLLRRAAAVRDGGHVEVRPDAGDHFEPRRSGVPVGFNAEGGDVPSPKATRVSDHESPDEHPSAVAVMPEGLDLVDVACPYAHGVKLAVDSSGVLHSIAWASDSEGASAAVRDLVVASSWLRDHADLVAVILGRRLSGLPSIRHLVLCDARGALGLAQGELRVHVAAPGARALLDLN